MNKKEYMPPQSEEYQFVSESSILTYSNIDMGGEAPLDTRKKRRSNRPPWMREEEPEERGFWM